MTQGGKFLVDHNNSRNVRVGEYGNPGMDNKGFDKKEEQKALR